MDKTQLKAFLAPLLDERAIGVSGDDEVTAPICAEIRAFLVGRLGDLLPTYSDYAINPRGGYDPELTRRRAAALAALLREVADGIDPAQKMSWSEARARLTELSDHCVGANLHEAWMIKHAAELALLLPALATGAFEEVKS